jgi:hypothetical protein
MVKKIEDTNFQKRLFESSPLPVEWVVRKQLAKSGK